MRLDLTYNNEDEIIKYEKLITELNILRILLVNFPKSILKLINIKILFSNYNSLTSLPIEINLLSNLTFLSLYHNKLENIPESIGNLNNLSHLYIEYNNLKYLPNSIGKLTNLTKLDIFLIKYINYRNLLLN